MRLLIWNCKEGISKNEQINYLKSFQADILVIPELKEKNIESLDPDDSYWVTNNHKSKTPKGLGILTFNDFNVRPLSYDKDMEIYLPVEISKGDLNFNLLAVWNFYSAAKHGRFKAIRGDNAVEYSAIRFYEHLFKKPCIVAGDFNIGPTISSRAYFKIVKMLQDRGLESLLHVFLNLPLKDSSYPTFISTRGKNCHMIDHAFGTKEFYQSIKELYVDDLNNSVLSDHAPYLVQFDLLF